MGNSLSGGRRSSRGSGSSHGASDDALRLAIESLNAAEQAALKSLFEKVSSGGALDRAKMAAHFTSDVILDYGGLLYDVLARRGATRSQVAFMAAVAKCARGTQTATIRLFWDICATAVAAAQAAAATTSATESAADGSGAATSASAATEATDGAADAAGSTPSTPTPTAGPSTTSTSTTTSSTTTGGMTREYLLFCLISELGNCSLEGIADTALVLTQSMEKFNARKRSGPKSSYIETDTPTASASASASGGSGGSASGGGRTSVSAEEEAEAQFVAFMEWVNEYTPNLSRLFVTYLNLVCFPDVELLSFTPFCPPVLEMESLVATHSRLLPLALYTNYMQGKWKRLYTTERDGVSFNRVAHNILGYGGPTCLLIQCVECDAVFGVFSGAAWKESNRFYGTSDSFLFTLSPEFRILRALPTTNGAYQWLNLKSYGLPHGLGVGGTTDNFRFFLPDSLENGTVRVECDTFESGRLIPKGSTFNIINLEVWGCGGDLVVEEALAAQKKDRAVRDDLIRKARTVDKAAFFENKFDQEFLLAKTFSHKVRMSRRESDPTKESTDDSHC